MISGTVPAAISTRRLSRQENGFERGGKLRLTSTAITAPNSSASPSSSAPSDATLPRNQADDRDQDDAEQQQHGLQRSFRKPLELKDAVDVDRHGNEYEAGKRRSGSCARDEEVFPGRGVKRDQRDVILLPEPIHPRP